MSWDDFEMAALQSYLDWVKNMTKEEFDSWMQKRVNNLSDEGYRIYSLMVTAHGIKPRERQVELSGTN